MKRVGSVFTCALCLCLAGCSTRTYEHTIRVVLEDPSARLGSGPVQVSIFDSRMGVSSEWAATTMGTTEAGVPHVGRVSGTATKTIFDSTLPGNVVVGLAIPALNAAGYYNVSLAPQPKAEKAIAAPFVPYGEAFVARGAVPPLSLRFSSVAGEHGWTIVLTVEVPQPSPHPPSLP